jgi:endonuclease I
MGLAGACGGSAVVGPGRDDVGSGEEQVGDGYGDGYGDEDRDGDVDGHVDEGGAEDAFDAFDAATDGEADAVPPADAIEVAEPVDAAEAGDADEGDVGDGHGGGDADGGTDAGYAGIYAGLEDAAGPELVRRLCALVHDGYASVSYSTAGDLVRDEVDNVGGQVQEIYSGIWQSPGGLNIEHTWPQSKGADAVPPKSDMFHLYASNPNYNSPRGNLPYGTVVNKDWPTTNEVCNHACTDHFPGREDVGCCTIRGTDGSGVKVFEPRDAHKGNVARAVFYFALRYGTDCALKPLEEYDGYGTAHASMTETLYKEWNRLDPPDANERTRNDRIETHQKVRNPFIDHPEFLDRIDFTP